ncbi:hypothetical protein OA525_00235 [Alphaproteobacteria bacterium]|nr:hypothetical protein [Alphaproteobacteria bacterium]
MIKIGVIGTSPNNGHIYSYSSIINGFDEYKLKKLCPFKNITNYLIENKNKTNFDSTISVNNIFTQNKILSENIASICKIENIYLNKKKIIKDSDIIFILKNDVKDNFNLAKICIEFDKPFICDKLFALSFKSFANLKHQKDFLFFNFSPLVLHKNIKYLIKNRKSIRRIDIYMKGEMFDYFGHAFDPIFHIFPNSDITNVKNKSKKIQLNISNILINVHFESNLNLIYKVYYDNSFIEKIYFDEYFNCFRMYLIHFLKLFNKKKSNNFDQITLKTYSLLDKLIR